MIVWQKGKKYGIKIFVGLISDNLDTGFLHAHQKDMGIIIFKLLIYVKFQFL